jgi:hypothetical protein
VVEDVSDVGHESHPNQEIKVQQGLAHAGYD